MSAGRSWLLVGALLIVGGGLFLAAGIMTFVEDSDEFFLGLYYGLILTVPFLVSGALIIAHLPRHRIGWVLWSIGFLQATSFFSGAWAEYDDGALPFAQAALVYYEVSWIPAIALLVTLLPLLFPTGRPPTPRWRWVEWLSLTGLALVMVAGLTYVWTLDLDPITHEQTSEAPAVLAALVRPVIAVLVVSAVASIISLVVRFRRSRGLERQQLKWFTFAVGLNALLAVSIFLPDWITDSEFSNVASLVVLALPISIGVAVLRYRLYEIDRVINRALVYGTLTALLVGAYVVLIVALQAVLESLTSGSDLAVAASTLAVAGLFRPLRSRVQRTVDRRFYRRKYDASHTVNAFAARLRDEVDLDVLSGELRAVVQEAVQPAHVSLWLRPPSQGM